MSVRSLRDTAGEAQPTYAAWTHAGSASRTALVVIRQTAPEADRSDLRRLVSLYVQLMADLADCRLDPPEATSEGRTGREGQDERLCPQTTGGPVRRGRLSRRPTHSGVGCVIAFHSLDLDQWSLKSGVPAQPAAVEARRRALASPCGRQR